MIGREEIATALVTQLSDQRMVTVVGPGGIGKTTVGLAVAARMIGAYEHCVWLIDLAPLRDPSLVPSAVAAVVGLETRTEDPLPGLDAALRDSQVLLLLENCEHVTDAAAGLAAAVLRGTSGVKILATSREPLRVPGEHVHLLGLLSKDKQRFFRALGIFAGGFNVEAAAVVAIDPATNGADGIDRRANLVVKSLDVADVSGAKPRFRLLDTTRADAMEKLDSSGDREATDHRHAEYPRQPFERVEAEALARTTSDWLAYHAPEIENVRAALDWAFLPGGEAATSVALTAAAVSFWTRSWLLSTTVAVGSMI
jgi:predicted ATPase